MAGRGDASRFPCCDPFVRLLAHNVPRLAPMRGSKRVFLTNSLPFARTVDVSWPAEWRLPARSDVIEAMQTANDSRKLLVALPPGGFAWLVESTDDSSNLATATRPLHPQTRPARGDRPLAEPLVLRNRHFEVSLSERTGGIASVAFHGRRGNRMSQQVCFRYEREQSLPHADGEDAPQKTAYADCVLVSHSIIESGSVFARVRTTSELRSPVDDSLLAVVTQHTSLNRMQPRIHVALTFDRVDMQPKGNPWLCYFGCRFAWDNEAAAITRSVLGHAAGFRSERLESPDYIEVSHDDQRLCIVPHGRPYHRRSGPRMIDSLLIVEGERSREFQFTLDFDQPFPLRTARDAMTPTGTIATSGRVPSKVSSGWILGLSARNVELVDAFPESTIAQSLSAHGLPSQVLNFIVSETEGVTTECFLRTACTPTAASVRVPGDSQTQPLEITGQGVRIPLGPFQLREVVLTF